MKESDKNRAVLAEVVARSWKEPAYRSKLRQNPKLVLQQAGATIPSDLEVVLLENTPTIIHAILPPMGEMAKYEARIQKAVQMLKDLPEDMEVHLHRDSATRAFIVLPEAPVQAGDLTDAQLEQVVGGKGSSHKDVAVNVNNVVTATQAVQTAVGVTTEAAAAEVVAAVVAVVVPCFIT
ncbi:MAG TPA: nitrile hydratase subunit alpha [Burkholderiales bacterium]|nr:nitrile hydratase subunit alpha [Burkholderiales bacterium]